MKKILFAIMMLIGTMSANAQFVVYQPAEVPRTTYTPSPGYGTPFSIYEPAYSNPYQQQQARPKMQEVTLKGYYKKGNDWYSMPIRVGVIGEEVNYKNFTIQSIQIGLPLTSSMNTLAGCISSNAIRSEI